MQRSNGSEEKSHTAVQGPCHPNQFSSVSLRFLRPRPCFPSINPTWSRHSHRPNIQSSCWTIGCLCICFRIKMAQTHRHDGCTHYLGALYSKFQGADEEYEYRMRSLPSHSHIHPKTCTHLQVWFSRFIAIELDPSASGRNTRFSNCSLPFSIFDKSRMSLIMTLRFLRAEEMILV